MIFGGEAMHLGKLAELAEKLWDPEDEDQGLWVDTPFGWLEAYRLNSYRGYYDELALTVGDDFDFDRWVVGDLVCELREAIGKVFEGYKGGSYMMKPSTIVYVVLGRSKTSSLVASGIEKLEGGGYLLKTALREY